MATRLTDINVKKVSFVRRAANRRKFLLMKSADVDSDTDDGGSSNNNNRSKEVPMDEKLKKALAEICKQERDPKKVINLLKSDDKYSDINVDDTVEKSVRDALALSAVITPEQQDTGSAGDGGKTDPAATTTADDVKEVLKQQREDIATLKKENEDLRQESAIRVETEWFEKEAKLASGDRDKIAERLVRLKKSDEDAYKAYRESLQAESTANRRSSMFDEVGTSAAGSTEVGGLGSPIFTELEKNRDTLRKSGDESDPKKDLEAIRSAVKKAGREAYDSYVTGHAARAKRLGGSASAELN